MLKEVAEVYSEAILDQAIAHYGLSREQLALVDSNTDVVYESQRDGSPIILKLIHSSQATRAFVCGEVWVGGRAFNFLDHDLFLFILVITISYQKQGHDRRTAYKDLYARRPRGRVSRRSLFMKIVHIYG